MKRVLSSLILFAACGGDSSHVVDGNSGAPPDYAWYVLDETSGMTARDSSPNHYDITNLTGVTWANGASFDGTGGGGSVAVDAAYRRAPITITAWATATTRGDQTVDTHGLLPFPSTIIGDDIAGNSGYGIGLDIWTDGTPGAAMIVEGVGTCANGMLECAVPQIQQGSPITFAPRTEYLLAMVVGSDGSANVYVDGELFNNTTAPPLSSAATTLWLGEHDDDTVYATKRFFAGTIRDARVYKRALTAGELHQLYTAGPTLHAPI